MLVSTAKTLRTGIKRAVKGTAWRIDVCIPVGTLIDNGKLANQIARLVAIVVKTYWWTSINSAYTNSIQIAFLRFILVSVYTASSHY